MYCQHCGHKNNPGAKFCEACGKPAAVAAVTPPSGGTANTNLKIFALVALIAVAAVVVWIVVGQAGGSMGGPTEEDIADLYDGVLSSDITILREAKCGLSSAEKSEGYEAKWIVQFTNQESILGKNYVNTPVLGYDGINWVQILRVNRETGCPRLQ